MARLDEFIFGYRIGKVSPDSLPRMINTALRLGICSDVTSDGEFTVKEKDRARFATAARAKMRFELGEPLGIFGFLMRNKKKYGVFLAVLFCAVLFLLSRSLVWDVRISGNESLSELAVEDALSKVGFGVGTRWRRIDKNEIETAVLSNNPSIAWISLNRRGTVAYVELIESENVGIREEVAPLYSNVVAERDGVIEEITVKSGEAMVKVGDVVRAGDILISGIIENDSGVRFCRAVGSVRASGVTEISAEVARSTRERVECARYIAEVRVSLFNFSINIFKNYGNCENGCDIIEEIRDFALFGRCKLPISLEKTYAVEYTELSRVRSDSEMTAEAKKMLDESMRTELRDADVVRLGTSGGFSGDSYRLATRVVYISEIGKESAIEIN